ncbi:hypothetical protein LQZ19_18585 [Treponema primitia]|uniref:hypothetical protein n=1 Tax=Treponema primitia TaxID=88058 RepID=UPI00397EF307
MRSVPRTTLLAVFFVSVLTALPLGAQTVPELPAKLPAEKFTLALQGSVLAFPEDNGLDSDSGPILPSLGILAAWTLVKSFQIELSLDFYGVYYAYSYKLDRPVPAIPDNRSAFVIGSILGVQALKTFPLSDTLRLRAYGGPAADLRICLVADGLEGEDEKDASKQTSDISAYFWDRGHWFMPVIGAGLDFNLTEKLRMGLDTRVWFPAYRLWTGESLPSIEGWRFGVGLRFNIL